MSNDLIRLIRPRVSLAVAAGTLFGALYHGTGGLAPWFASAGAFLLCSGCSVLNQVQERDRDRRMERTMDRPLASGQMPVRRGGVLAVALALAGLGLFFQTGGWPLLALGLGIVLVYNGIYTPLKPVTPLALLAGGFAGAVPPLAGWLAVGGSAGDPRILSVTTIFYLWQVPHFWLLAEKHRRDYERAGFALLHAALPEGFRHRLMGVWVGAYFVGLGCLAWLAGAGALRLVVPPGMMLVGGLAVGCAVTRRWRFASAAMHASLPMGLLPLLMNGT
ncbi:UbiA family prenyltransferase [Pseudodesulfovibrio portus]|uniref:heme o synthase n=1 Tax=Pseudodesulfovibrio portus TaxID=231439 RepID=A0ABM8AUK8_9BACT|nr:UbiA family prenyltransferase [Pseudodesulfovibrio portus]BDQ34977.1 hypothetical protein JCM14722_25190 [Pseudodesulfovibrio portus]